MKRALIFVVVLLLLVGVTGGLGYFQFVVKPEMIKGFIAKAAPPPPVVAVTQARTETWTPKLPAIGSFRAYQGIDVAPQLGGIIQAIHADSGQDVAQGAALFDIDTSVEQADLKSNLATLKNADFQLERQRQLNASGNTTKANLDAAEAARDSAAAAVERVRATIAQKTLVAPFSGRLGIRRADLGQYVSPGTGLIPLQQLDPIFVDFQLPEQSLALLKPGQTVDVRVDAYQNRVFHGVLKTIDARVNADTRNVMLRAEVENKDLKLLPGMFANVTVAAGTPAATVTLPRTAIVFTLYGDSVFVVKPVPPAAGSAQAATPGDQPMQVERRFVRTGEMQEDRIAVLEGVTSGEKVVTEGQLKLQPDMRVTVDPNAGLTPPAVRPKE